MSYFFPLGVPQSGSYATTTVTAVTASHPSASTIFVATASYASIVLTSGSTGPTGVAPTNCVGTVSGSQGPQGPSGSQGPSLTTCPAGSVQCTELTPPTGYAMVCIEIPSGCTAEDTVCPGSLP